MAKSQAVATQKEKEKTLTEGLVYTQDEVVHNAELERRFDFAREQRDRTHRHFDDLTYLADYQANEDAIYTYLRPKLNDGEVRINTATSEKKLETVKNEILSFNFKSEVRSFDENNNEIEQLGDDFTDIVKQTETQESADDMDEEALTQLLGQRALFMEEVFVDEEIVDKRQFRAKNGVIKIRIQKPEKRLLDGRQIYLGDITMPARRFNDQPYYLKVERKTWEQVRLIYKDNPRWRFVKAGTPDSDSKAFNYRFNKGLEKNEVEIIHYYSFPDDEYQVKIQGVLMLALGTPLPYEKEGYNVTMTVTKAIPGFAYGKQLISSAKTVQGLENETIRLMIRKMRQGIDQPMVSRRKTGGKDIWAPGSVVKGMPGDFERLLDHNGVNQSEFNMFSLISKITAEFIGASRLSQGVEGDKKTARESILLQRNFIKNLGHSILAWKRVIRDMALLRIYNVLENFSEPIGKVKDQRTGKVINVFRRFSINDAKLEDGRTGKKIIQFLDRQITEEEEVAIFKKQNEQELKGKRLRFRTINVTALRQFPMFWYVVVNPQEQEGSEIDKLTFTDKLNQAVGIAEVTQRPLNADKWIDSFERTYNDTDLFLDPQQGAGQPLDAGVAGEAQVLQGEIQEIEKSFQGSQLGASRSPRPSVNTLEQ